MTDDYSVWLTQVKTAVEAAGNTAGIARWLAHRVGIKATSVNTKLHKMLGQTQEPRGTFIAAVNAWMASGCPVVQPESDGRKKVPEAVKKSRAASGGKARAAILSKEQRIAIAKNARAARRSESQP